MFHYNRYLPPDLQHYELSAKHVAANLEKPRTFSFGKAAREDEAKGLREVEMLCGEMARRLKAEVPRERWMVTMGAREDGTPHEWYERMGDEWLKATDKSPKGFVEALLLVLVAKILG
ncbi:MAG: hypothetical protein Q9193_005768 [Seirophora villosa]